METKTYTGLLAVHDWVEASDILFLSSIEEPFGERLEEDIARQQVTVRYWITDKEATKDEAQAEFLKMIMGVGNCKFGSVYSDYTGYLWTDEECKVGGHDLMAELRSNAGKWLILEVDIHDGSAQEMALRAEADRSDSAKLVLADWLDECGRHNEANEIRRTYGAE